MTLPVGRKMVFGWLREAQILACDGLNTGSWFLAGLKRDGRCAIHDGTVQSYHILAEYDIIRGMKTRIAVGGLAFAVACASFGVSAGDGVVLTPGRTEVLIAPDAPKTVQFAAIDLTNHLARIFGSEVPVVTPVSTAHRTAL